MLETLATARRVAPLPIPALITGAIDPEVEIDLSGGIATEPEDWKVARARVWRTLNCGHLPIYRGWRKTVSPEGSQSRVGWRSPAE